MKVDQETGIFDFGDTKLHNFRINNYSIGSLFYNDLQINYETIKYSQWDKEDFLTFIKYKEDRSELMKIELCTQDLKRNIDKYLNEIIIKDIIE